MLARYYPGIPSDYRSWPDVEKEAWLANVDWAVINEERVVQSVQPTTKEGVYNRVLAVTDDPVLAEKFSIQFAVDQKIANLPPSLIVKERK